MSYKKIGVLVFCMLMVGSLTYGQLPQLEWAAVMTDSTLGGGNVEITSLEIEPVSGDIFIAGHFNKAADFDPTLTGTYYVTSGSFSSCGFIARYTSDYNLIWVYRIASGGSLSLSALDLDEYGSLYITGVVYRTGDFDSTTASPEVSNNSSQVYLARYSQLGTFDWVISFGEGGFLHGMDVCADPDGSPIISGSFYSQTTDVDPSSNTQTITAPSFSEDMFVVKYDSLGNYVWHFESSSVIGYHEARAVDCDGEGDVYITGSITDSAILEGDTFVFGSSQPNLLLMKLSKDGEYLWAWHTGASNFDQGNDIHVHSDNEIIITGTFKGNVDFDADTGTYMLDAGTNQEMFLAKYDSLGGLNWAIDIGGNASLGYATGRKLSTNSTGDILVTGIYRYSVDFDPGSGSSILTTPSYNYNAFYGKYTGTGLYVWAKAISGSEESYGNDIAFLDSTQLIFAGRFKGSTDFNPSLLTQNQTPPSGFKNGFMAEYALANGSYQNVKVIGKVDHYESYIGEIEMAVDHNGNTYITGYVNGTVDMDPSGNTWNVTSSGDYDIVLAKYDASGQFSWAFSIGSTNEDRPTSILVDTMGNVILTGIFYSSSIDLDPSSGFDTLSLSDDRDGFVAKYTGSGDLIWSVHISGNSNEDPQVMTIHDGNIVLAGTFSNEITIGSTTASAYGYSYKMFVSSLSVATGSVNWITRQDGSSGASGTLVPNTLSHRPDAGYLLGGLMVGTVDMDPGTSSILETSVGTSDAMLYFISDGGNYEDHIVFHDGGNGAINDLEYDGDSALYIVGVYKDTLDFDTTLNQELVVSSTPAIFVAKYLTSGSVGWVGSIHGESTQNVTSHLELEVMGNELYLAGDQFKSLDFDMDSTVFEATILSSYSHFLAKYDTAGSFSWIKTITTMGRNRFYDMELDQQGQIYMAGNFSQTYDLATFGQVFTPSSLSLNSDYIAKYRDCYDSFDTLILNVCDSYESPSGKTYNVSGTYSDTILNASSCDSILSIYLTVNYSSQSDTSISVCDSFYWPLSDDTYFISGTYFDTMTNALGCDSVRLLHLTILNNQTLYEEFACDSFYWAQTDLTYYTTGTYNDTLVNAFGCDSVIALDLIVYESIESTQVEHGCDNFTWAANGQVLSSSGIYYDTLQTNQGCDSSITLDLTIHLPGFDTIAVNVCDSFYSPVSQSTYFTSGLYSHLLTDQYGCDSMVTIDLDVHYTSWDTLDTAVCSSFFWLQTNSTYTEEGTYTDTTSNVFGCDSIMVLQLTLLKDMDTLMVSTCDSFTLSPAGPTYYNSGIYNDTFTNVYGCDSIVTLMLELNYSSSDTDTVSACDGYTWAINGQLYLTPGIYTVYFTSIEGCDSSHTLVLSLGSTQINSVHVTACDSFTWANGNTYLLSGTYQETFTTLFGCDSLVTLYLSLNTSSIHSKEGFGCSTFNWYVTNQNYFESGIYSDTFIGSQGCDSIMILNLTIDTVNTNVYDSAATLIAIADSATFQWLVCDSLGNLELIPNETNHTYSPPENGWFAVQVSQGNCTDTSECLQVSNVGFRSLESETIKFFPNPTNGDFYVEITAESSYEMQVLDVLGKIIFRGVISTGTDRFEILRQAPSGTYFIRLINKYETWSNKIIKL